ncbi:GGDEF domain-containing protein [Megalodesulfovibrio gigas]|uniref:Putative diguanylate cyclase/phosphodiesterase n=1 Tax=Megalodesulfovibrio gigas (strain ATCC 19364 / DSM 1382 / NCIMB 9332 / VKM B-1759) TaxID=1121448 RepID=T2G7X7_MEGG1|nr:bifunctional diguanylate cyclase/phosphodiesterase [Megalodesulfovibrio gigas]AGW12680.1 putative diguanylate cyclase/phosphodiesterase [Megalodesulfovibrio gigas DSM 1382 = ATCC 19364]
MRNRHQPSPPSADSAAPLASPVFRKTEPQTSACGFISLQALHQLEHAAHAGAVGLLYVDVEDFFLLVGGLGEDAGYSLLESLQRETRDRFHLQYPDGRILAVEPVGVSGFVLFFHQAEENPLKAVNAFATLRFTLQEAMQLRHAQALGREFRLLVGQSFLRRQNGEPLDKCLFRAFCEAQRMAHIRPDSDQFSLHREFVRVMETGGVAVLFQPVIDFATGETLGWEALTRGPVAGPLFDAATLFRFALDAGEVVALDRLCRRKAIEHFATARHAMPALLADRKLFLNVHAASLQQHAELFEDACTLLRQKGLSPRDVVVELSERQCQKDPDLLLRKLETCREYGFRVALDDVGAGNTSLQLLSMSRPDFIKVDISLTSGIDTNPFKRVMVETLVLLAGKFGGAVLAEGVESDTEFSSLVSMGVTAGQGYLFCRPVPGFESPQVPIPAKASLQEVGRANVQCSTPIAELVQEAVTAPPHALVKDVKEQLLKEAGDKGAISSLVVLSHATPLGLVMCYSLDRKLGTRYGVSLYYQRSVDRIMDPHPLIVDGSLPLEDVAKAAMDRPQEHIYDDIIVTKNGQLAGVVSVQRMLDTLTQVQVELAKGSNPLTGLPGNVAIEQEIERRIRQQTPSSLLYVDLDNFKVYNDVYGFNNGDRIIMSTAKTLKDAVQQHGRSEDFIGHIGGDDFLIIARQDRADAIANAAAAAFGQAVLEHYTEEDRARGYIEAKGRDGQPGRFPMVSASIGILDIAFDVPFTMAELGQRAAEIKKFAKSKPGNSVVRDRRAAVGAVSAAGAR